MAELVTQGVCGNIVVTVERGQTPLMAWGSGVCIMAINFLRSGCPAVQVTNHTMKRQDFVEKRLKEQMSQLVTPAEKFFFVRTFDRDPDTEVGGRIHKNEYDFGTEIITIRRTA